VATFTRSFLRNLHDRLKGWKFKLIAPEDFVIEPSEKGDRVSVRYLHEKFVFALQLLDKFGSQSDDVVRYFVVESPGEVTDTKRGSYQGEAALFAGLYQWATRINDELEAVPHVKMLFEHAQRIQQLETTLEDFPDHPASQEELQDLANRLDEYERQVAETLTASAGALESVQETISKLHAEIEMLKGSMQGTTVRGAIRLAMVRLWSYAKSPNAPKEIGAALKTAKAIGDGVTEIIS
jgi:hypothetical protein